MKRNKLLLAFGEEVRRRRAAAGMTLEDLGEKADLTANFIGGIEMATRNPSLLSCLSVARGLGVPLADLLGGFEGLTPSGLEGGRLLDALPPKVRRAALALLRGLARA